MSDTEKKAKVLAMAASHGIPLGLYPAIVAELVKSGQIEERQTFSKVGARGSRYFITEAR